MRAIGLTGGIGSGKSTVARMLEDLGAVVIDADKVGHGIYAPGTPGFEAVVGAFGPEIVAPDGAVDRKKLGARVFADPAELARLNRLLHPIMGEEIRRRIGALRAGGETRPIVVEAAVLLEAGWDAIVDAVWVVTASREAAIGRVVATRPLGREEVERRIEGQLSDAERVRRAHVVIRNDGSVEDLRAEVARAWRDHLER